ncbi:maternal B9.15 protein-like [Ischnura elegans]|uniref:maternal B9.15 protein-like n=1 Tax=Ischnura elegans TaxID=197161 RepID=UPI001ED89097|nr:maternal B9.15 protein-like [Ischnura elegans]XP_046399845.1 maternal B9.15 protein-like [Ischnura elegans]XP_046399846.1 maternal B9.15 protein-like [Ischnura elegans]XP_046399847.1 maternal B9.15 protein-like [Ischnura elegans]
MKEEISAAVVFLVRLIGRNENFNTEQLEGLERRLSELLLERFQGHWFPDRPARGQGYRCIRLNGSDRSDPVLQKAAVDCGLKYEDLRLPPELTVWVDPEEVACRFGEHKGSYCTLASFKDCSKENAKETRSCETSEGARILHPEFPAKQKSTNSPVSFNDGLSMRSGDVGGSQPTILRPHAGDQRNGSVFMLPPPQQLHSQILYPPNQNIPSRKILSRMNSITAPYLSHHGDPRSQMSSNGGLPWMPQPVLKV